MTSGKISRLMDIALISRAATRPSKEPDYNAEWIEGTQVLAEEFLGISYTTVL